MAEKSPSSGTGQKKPKPSASSPPPPKYVPPPQARLVDYKKRKPGLLDADKQNETNRHNPY